MTNIKKFVHIIAQYISDYIGGSDAYEEETTPEEVLYHIAEENKKNKDGDILESAIQYLISIYEGENLPVKSKLMTWEILHVIGLPHVVIQYYMIDKLMYLNYKTKKEGVYV